MEKRIKIFFNSGSTPLEINVNENEFSIIIAWLNGIKENVYKIENAYGHDKACYLTRQSISHIVEM
ncbi:hypothetical protein [Clostridium pasteurianum]|nr:hypothetical protein [Clostridium pasteurianum]